MFFVLEGADGTGKSTQAKKLAKCFGAVSYTLPKEFRERSSHIKNHAQPADQYKFFRDGVCAASAEVEILLDKGFMVIADRYWVTTLTYFETMGQDAKVDHFSDLLMPNLTFLLSADPDSQVMRITERGLEKGDRVLLDRQLELSARLYQNLVRYRQPFVAVDTVAFSEDETSNLIEGVIRQRLDLT